MADLKLNNLVDLLLVVGSDTSSGLELHRSSKTHPRFRNNKCNGGMGKNRNTSRRRENPSFSIGEDDSLLKVKGKDEHDGNHNFKQDPHSKVQVELLLDELSTSYEDDEEDDDISLQLTDPNADYHAKVLQIFSSNLASYPHRGADEQLADYPHQLLTSVPSPSSNDVRDDETVDEEYDEFDSQKLPSILRRNRRMSQQPGRNASVTSGTGTFLSYDAPPRRHSLSVLALGTGSRLVSGLTRRSSLQRGISVPPAVAMCKNKTTEMPLSLEQIGAICNLSYPVGFRCYELSQKPSIVTYVLTDLEGNRFYAVSLTFHKKFTVTSLTQDDGKSEYNDDTPRYKLTDPQDQKIALNTHNENSSAVDVYLPTCVVLVTSYPYYNTLHKCLSEFYTAIQPNFTGFDEQVRQLASAVTNIPVPPSGGELSLTFKVQRHGFRLTVNPAEHPSRPVTDLNMNILFTLLHPSVICTVISAMLQEQRLVFVSSRYSLLTLMQETFMYLIYPFRWQSMYVPVLNAAMITLLEAPGYFVMGCHSDFLETTRLVEGLVVVDLDKGQVTPSINEQITGLPLKAASNFCTKILDTEMDFDLYMSGQVYQNLANAKEEFQHRINREISGIGLSMMVDLFREVHDHVITEQKFFDRAAFLSAQTAEDQQFYINVLETSMFKAFLREIMSESCPDMWTIKATENQRKSSVRPGSRHRSVQSRDHKKSLVAIQYENSCKVFNLPYMMNLAQFQEDSLLNLSSFLDVPSTSKLSRAACLYLIGSINLHSHQVVQALNNFGDLYNRDSSLFPEAAIVKVLNNEDYPGDIVGEVKPVYRKLYKDMLLTSQSKRKTYGTDVKVDLESLPKVAVDEQEFQKYAERLDLAVGRDAINRLYRALTLGADCELEAEHIKLFYECWKDSEAECRDIETTLTSKCTDGDFTDITVLKVSSSLVRTDYGNGTVILTSSALLLLKSGCQMESVTEISRLSNISKLQVENVKIVLKPVLCLRVFTGKTAKPINIFLESESNTWLILLNELIGGKMISTNIRDLFLMQQAAQSTLLLDALITSSKSTSPRCIHSQDVDKAVDILSYYSKEETKHNLLISCDATKDNLLYRLNPNADELDSTTVECIIYIPGSNNSPSSTGSMSTSEFARKSVSMARSSSSNSNETCPPTVWCGMANGKIRIFDAASWRLYPRHVQAGDRVVCLAYSNRRIWAGSFDCHIYVIENNPLALEFQTLSQHNDYVVDLQNDPQSQDSLFSAGINGTIVQWNADRLEVLREITCPHSPVKSMKVVSHDEIWCCCRDRLVKMDISANIRSTLYYIDERDLRVNLECFCIVGDDIWAGCSDTGRVHIWNMRSETKIAILPLEARGISQIVSIGNCLYLGCKSNPISRRSLAGSAPTNMDSIVKSKLYIVDAVNYRITEGLSAHNDSIRCMFVVGDQYLLTGSASREGKIAIWKHRPVESDTSV